MPQQSVEMRTLEDGVAHLVRGRVRGRARGRVRVRGRVRIGSG